MLYLIARRVGVSDVGQALSAVGRPGWLIAALACVAVVLASDSASMAVLARALAPSISPWAAAGVTLESRLVEGATSFGGLEIPFQIVRLRGLGLNTSEGSSVVLVKGLAHATIVLATALVALVPGIGSPVTNLQKCVLLGAVLAVALLWTLAWLFSDVPAGCDSCRWRCSASWPSSPEPRTSSGERVGRCSWRSCSSSV